MNQLAGDSGALWYDDEAGPMVRPYTVTRGRTRTVAGVPDFDVIALVYALDGTEAPRDDALREPHDVRPTGGGPGTAAPDSTAGTGLADVAAGQDPARAKAGPGTAAGAVLAGAGPGTVAAGAGPGGGAAIAAGGEPVAGDRRAAGGGQATGRGAAEAAVGPQQAPGPGGTAGAGPPGTTGAVRHPRHASTSVRGRTDLLAEEHLILLDHCRADGPLSVAELAAGADLPLGVVRVLLGDLLDAGCVRITRPVPPAELPDVDLLQHVISGLRSL